jgi:hypothetical protein
METKQLRIKVLLGRDVKALPWVGAIVCLLALWCGCDEKTGQSRTWRVENSDAVFKAQQEEILTILRKAPVWTDLSRTNPKDPKIDLLKNAVASISHYKLPDIRAACERYFEEAKRSNGDPDFDALGKLLILNRYLFAVPQSEPDVQKVRFFGGWRGGPRKADLTSDDMLWPLQNSPSGLQLVGRDHGYLGEPYRPVAEFDYFRETYGLRTNARWSPIDEME